ncbi:helix-turn-helix domain-containing protein [Verticiella sediminum]|uniref:Helix-turn-helix domain-containing protein n=1 Tax=Verticiella sediminum TaxID=1247510 RepID=A0A556A9I8_9BURK|nr:helix-turn-helix domain-containing protein [Verticiella sediminum]TSH89558.1 helix-turn-helix domain-containing protein [Verticiella sediminum]
MDSLIAMAARALAAGDALGALQCVALREDPPALALRGIAMARLGDLARAQALLRQAARAFGAREPLARARCALALADVGLARRELAGWPDALPAAIVEFDARRERVNAAHARLLLSRYALLTGRPDEATALLARVPSQGIAPAALALRALVEAELALRRPAPAAARAALAQARTHAAAARIPELLAEAQGLEAMLALPAALRLEAGGAAPLTLAEIAALLDSRALVLDGCRRAWRRGSDVRPLLGRPVLYALSSELARAWPAAAPRAALIAAAFRIRRPDDTDRARLRVQIGRLRALLRPFARIEARPEGFALCPAGGAAVAMLAPPMPGEAGALLALLADGAAWSSSSLALALGGSQRSVQRLLARAELAGQVRALGRGRAQRWLAPRLAEFTTILLLPAAPGLV